MANQRRRNNNGNQPRFKIWQFCKAVSSDRFRKSPDDVGYLGANGDLNSYNLYAYCSNNPITYTDPSGHYIIATLLVGAAIGALSQLASDAVSSAIDGELSFSHWTSYVGAAAGGAVGSIMPGSKVLGDVIGSTVSTIVGMGGRNIVNRIQGGKI